MYLLVLCICTENLSLSATFRPSFSSPLGDAPEYRRWKTTSVNNVKVKSWTVLNRETMRFITGLIIYLKTISACWWLKSTKVEVRRYPLKKSPFKPQCKIFSGYLWDLKLQSLREIHAFVTENCRSIAIRLLLNFCAKRLGIQFLLYRIRELFELCNIVYVA